MGACKLRGLHLGICFEVVHFQEPTAPAGPRSSSYSLHYSLADVVAIHSSENPMSSFTYHAAKRSRRAPRTTLRPCQSLSTCVVYAVRQAHIVSQFQGRAASGVRPDCRDLPRWTRETMSTETLLAERAVRRRRFQTPRVQDSTARVAAILRLRAVW